MPTDYLFIIIQGSRVLVKVLGIAVEYNYVVTRVLKLVCTQAPILRSNISITNIIRILMCCVFFVLSYGCETWTYSKAINHKINAFEMWCYRRMLRICWTFHTTNIDIPQNIGVKETTMKNNMEKQKMSYAGHIRTL